LNARDDPFLTPECFPHTEAKRNPYIFLEAPESGGHVGFIDLANGLERWSERRVVEFLARVAVRLTRKSREPKRSRDSRVS
jgi:predicted alpha/beta-fold hydrolase